MTVKVVFRFKTSVQSKLSCDLTIETFIYFKVIYNRIVNRLALNSFTSDNKNTLPNNFLVGNLISHINILVTILKNQLLLKTKSVNK